MPFKSQAQRRKFAEMMVKGEISPETFEEWNRETGSAELPERVSRVGQSRGKKAGRKAAGPKKTRAKKTARKKTARKKTARNPTARKTTARKSRAAGKTAPKRRSSR